MTENIYMLTEIIGYIAAMCSAIAFMPQVIYSYKSKSTDDLSLVTFIVYNLGVILWLIYGVLIVSYPVILSCILASMSTLSILLMKIRYSNNK